MFAVSTTPVAHAFTSVGAIAHITGATVSMIAIFQAKAHWSEETLIQGQTILNTEPFVPAVIVCVILGLPIYQAGAAGETAFKNGPILVVTAVKNEIDEAVVSGGAKAQSSTLKLPPQLKSQFASVVIVKLPKG